MRRTGAADICYVFAIALFSQSSFFSLFWFFSPPQPSRPTFMERSQMPRAASRLGRFRQRSSEQASSLLRGRMVRFTFPKYQRAVMCSRSAAWDTAHSPYPFSLQRRTIAKNFYSRLRRITSAEPSRSKYAATSSKPRIGRPSEI